MNELWQFLLTLVSGITLGLALAHRMGIVSTLTRQQKPAAKMPLQPDQRFQGAFNTTAVGMAVVALDGTFIEVNSALCRFLGYSEPELIGRTFLEVTYPDDLTANLTLFEQLQQGKLSNYSLEKRYLHRLGHVVWGLVSVSLVRDDQQKPLYQVALLQDITERKRAEQILQEREALLRSISNNIPKGVLYQLVYDPRNNSLAFSYISPGIQDFLGVSAEAVVQDINALYDLLLPEDREQVERLTQASLENLTVYEAQVRQRKLENGVPMGAIVWSSSRATPRRMEDGRTVWDGVAVDITELKEAEAALRQSEKQMRAVLQAIPDLVLLANRHGRGLAYHNGGSVVFLSPEMDGDKGKFFDVFVLPEAVARDRIDCIHRALDTGALQTHEYELQINGETRFEEARVVASGIDEVVVFVRDMTETMRREAIRQQFEIELKQAKEAAEAANQAKSTFLSHVSHELRSPLNTVLGYAQLLARSPELTDTQREYLKILNRSGNHLAQIINDVLSLARIEAGRVSLKEQPIYLPDLLTHLQAIFEMRAGERGIPIHLEIATHVPRWIESDEGKLRQVLINLLDNAIKFTLQGSITLSVMLRSPQVLHFAVTDTGVGIAAKDLDSIFEAFTQTDSGERSRQGSGLGLTISARLVKLMGGEIWAESQLGRGTTLQFTLPLKPVQKNDGTRKPLSQGNPVFADTPIRLAPHQPAYRILVVDDIQVNADLMKQWLAPAGFEVRVAHDGVEAIEQWQQFSPHLIWMDLRMPKADGLEATAQIRAMEQAQPERPATKIIAVSATVFEDQRHRAFAAGCDDFVGKPYPAEILFTTLQFHLGVQYLHELFPTEIKPEVHRGTIAMPKLRPDDLQGMPSEWIVQLHQAARAAREASIKQLLDQIPTEQSQLRAAIAHLVDHFAFEQLIEVTEPLC